MSTFNLPFSVFIADRKPVDDRYVVNDEVERLNIGNSYRSFDGLQVYQKDTKKLYILNDYTTSDWVEVGGNQLKGLTNSTNTYLGEDSMINNWGLNNTFIGARAGYNNIGSNNIFIGNDAGYNETGSSKLYISNSNTSNPLIYGEFDNNLLKINGSLYLSGITNSATTQMLYFDSTTGKVSYSTAFSLSIGGSNTNVQFNDNGNLGGNNGFVYNKDTYDLTILGLIRGSNIRTNPTTSSTKIGINAGISESEITSALHNVFIGYASGNLNVGGSNNTFVGNRSGHSNLSNFNTFIGGESGLLNTGGVGNSFLGYRSGYRNTSAQYNTFIGYSCGLNTTIGGYNVMIGYNAGITNVTGESSVFIGAYAGYRERQSNKFYIDNQDRSSESNSRIASLIYGEFNSNPNNQLLRLNSKLQLPYITNSATTNVLYYDLITSGVSYGTISTSTPGGANNSIQINDNGIFGGLEDPILMENGVINFIYTDDDTNGYVFRNLNEGINFLYESFEYKLKYYNNITNLLNTNTTIFKINNLGDTTINGKLYVSGLTSSTTSNIVYYNTTTSELTYGIFNIISGTTDTNYTYIGYNSGINSSGSGNTFLGKSNGINNTANDNTFIGHESGCFNSNGDSNTFVGYKSGYNNIGGYRNVMVGVNAGLSNTSGYYNTFVGYESGSLNTTGSGNSFFGYASGNLNNGSNNTFVGNLSGFQSNSSNSTFVGYQSGYNTTGSNNVFVGAFVGQSNTTGTNNTYIGYGAGYSGINGASNVFIGYNAGYNETGSNKLYISNSNTSNPLIYGEFDNNLLKINGNLYISGMTNDDTPSDVVYYNSTTKKLTYGAKPTGGSSTSYQITGSTTFSTLTMVDSYSNTKDFCVYFYSVYSGSTEKRSGIITINNTTTEVTISEMNTSDIGNTSGVVFTVDNNVGGNGLVRLYVNTSSGTWTCKFIKNII